MTRCAACTIWKRTEPAAASSRRKRAQPCWSPDGRRIAFVKQEFSKFRIADYVSKGLYV